MIKRTVTALLTVCMGIAIGVLLAAAGHSGTATAAEMEKAVSPASVSNAAEISGYDVPGSLAVSEEEGKAASIGPGYYIKEYKGRVSVVRDGQEEPEMIFDIQTKMLPELDRQQLTEGIYVETYEELVRLVEDYIS